MDRTAIIGTIWKHYKGRLYTIIDVAYNSHSDETDGAQPIDSETYVVYRTMYDDPIYGNNSCWIRRKSDFLSKQNDSEYKFTKIS